MVSGAPPHDPVTYDGDQNLPCIAALLILPTKSCRSRREETPLRELTRWESATFGRYCTSRCVQAPWCLLVAQSAAAGSYVMLTRQGHF